MSGVVLDWFKSYLSDRVQCIKIGSILSDAQKLLYGVPQGSVLGPILFTPQPFRPVGVLFSPMVSGWAGGRREIVCPGCISETVRCRKLILGRDIG